MNIFALKGHRVRCETLGGNYTPCADIAREYLEIGKEYTIEETQVYSWNTEVYLQEFPDVVFNSVFFVDVSKQTQKQDKEHPDYMRFN